MLNFFQSYINDNKLCSKKQKILVAISGGPDSVILTHLFLLAGYNISLAHCNFNLRGVESDKDQLFVTELAKELNIKLHLNSFNTKEYSRNNKISIEMAARHLRYSWFEQLLQQNKYDLLATGHHLNDSIETFMINLSRGTGLKGLTGIKPKNGHIIRPLLFATRQQIEDYIETQQLETRHDSSNDSDIYLRNIVRNELMPIMKRLNPSFELTMRKNMSILNQSQSLLTACIQEIKENILSEKNNRVSISISKLKKQENVEFILFKLIKSFSFNFCATQNILEAIETTPGKIFYSDSHKLLIDRSEIIIEEIPDNEISEFTISTINDLQILPFSISHKIILKNDFKLIKDNKIACLDSDKITFPLTVRKWRNSDSFYPLGMTKQKKISNFFIDNKVDRFTKEKTWIIESDNKIIWVIGMRIDNRFKVTSSSNTILILSV